MQGCTAIQADVLNFMDRGIGVPSVCIKNLLCRAELVHVARERGKEIDRFSCMLWNGNVLDLSNRSLRLLVVKLLYT